MGHLLTANGWINFMGKALGLIGVIVVQGIDYGPFFSWWVQYVLKTGGNLLALIRRWQARNMKKCHKHMIKISQHNRNGATKNDISCADAIQNVSRWREGPHWISVFKCHIAFDTMIKISLWFNQSSNFKEYNGPKFCRGSKESIPLGAPEPQGKRLTCYR